MKKLTKAIILTSSIYCLFGCTNDSKATSVLAAQGYTNIQTTGYNFMACSKGDFYNTGFSAKSPTGQQINGTVCSGLLFKGSTIRFD
jgi:hypothetical protein